MSEINFFNVDCVEFMKTKPDNYYDLAIVDPPYGIGVAGAIHIRKPDRPSTWDMIEKYDRKEWDNEIPNKEYFEQLFRISRNQIIWGGNYFPLRNSRYFAIWDKGETMYNRDFAECEYAWVSNGGTRIFKTTPNQLNRIHPTQKPVALYNWLLENYAKQGDKILDTHLGSQSSRIAAYKKGFDFWGYEIDKDYFEQGNERFEKSIAMPLFDAPKELSCRQLSLA